MATDDPSPSGRSLDRAALERVLARAAELQAASTDPGDVADDLTESQIVDLGKEVGLSQQHLRQALAEERTRVALPTRDRAVRGVLLGAAGVRASRVVACTPSAALATVDTWMQRDECLQIKRRVGDRMLWEPRRDFVGNVKRALNIGGRGYALTRAVQVACTVTVVDDKRALVTFEADLSNHRNGAVAAALAATTLGVGATGVLAVIGVFFPVAVVPAALIPVASLVVARNTHRHVIERAQLALEQLLDRLERGEPPQQPSILSALAAAAALPPRRP